MADREQGWGFSPVVPQAFRLPPLGTPERVTTPSVSPEEPGAAVAPLPLGPGTFLLTPMTQASAAGQASPRWDGLCQESVV